MKQMHPFVLSLLGVALLSACTPKSPTDAAQAPATPTPPPVASTSVPPPATIPVQNEAGAPATPAATAAGEDASADADFYTQALAAGEQEIEASQLAATQSSNDDVKSAATMLIHDHSALAQQISAASHLTGIAAADPAAIDELKAKSGTEFDKAYLGAMKRGHEKAITLFKKESEGGKTNTARSLASGALPKLHQHFKMVSKILDKMPGAKKK